VNRGWLGPGGGCTQRREKRMRPPIFSPPLPGLSNTFYSGSSGLVGWPTTCGPATASRTRSLRGRPHRPKQHDLVARKSWACRTRHWACFDVGCGLGAGQWSGTRPGITAVKAASRDSPRRKAGLGAGKAHPRRRAGHGGGMDERDPPPRLPATCPERGSSEKRVQLTFG